MTDPVQALRNMAAGMRDLDRQVTQLTEGLYAAADEAETVEVTLDGHGRMVDLRLDDRLLGLGAHEAAKRILEVHAAATDLIDETYAEALPDLEADAEQAVAMLDAAAQDQTRRDSE